jgi:hypothetical protein
MASATMAFILANSSGVASLRCEASSPITAVRMVEWPASTAMLA